MRWDEQIRARRGCGRRGKPGSRNESLMFEHIAIQTAEFSNSCLFQFSCLTLVFYRNTSLAFFRFPRQPLSQEFLLKTGDHRVSPWCIAWLTISRATCHVSCSRRKQFEISHYKTFGVSATYIVFTQMSVMSSKPRSFFENHSDSGLLAQNLSYWCHLLAFNA